jgi:hypothetical protein
MLTRFSTLGLAAKGKVQTMNNLLKHYDERQKELVIARTIAGAFIVGGIVSGIVCSLVTYIICR